MFPESIDTDRLRLERLCHETVDLLEFYSVCSGGGGDGGGSDGSDAGSGDSEIEAITRYMPWSPHETIVESKAFIDHAEKRWSDGDRAKYVYRPPRRLGAPYRRDLDVAS